MSVARCIIQRSGLFPKADLAVVRFSGSGVILRPSMIPAPIDSSISFTEPSRQLSLVQRAHARLKAGMIQADVAYDRCTIVDKNSEDR
jgi:hypothetical protein